MSSNLNSLNNSLNLNDTTNTVKSNPLDLGEPLKLSEPVGTEFESTTAPVSTPSKSLGTSSTSTRSPLSNSTSATSSSGQTANSGNTKLAENLTSLKDSVINTTSSAMSAVNDHPTTQQVKDTVVNGPVGQTVQEQSAKTSNEFSDLANAKRIPSQPAATGQPLTHYHSLFYRLLSWKNPRATGIVYATLVSLIFASRYLNVLGYALKGTYTVLGITALAEVAGKAAFGNGIATQLRPRKYWTIRKESLERFLDDVEQLINFAVIEAQRIVYVENIYVTIAAFAASFVSYFLIKLLPFWGLTLLGTSVTFLGPLIYFSNQELIDGQINHANNLISSQAAQVRDVAAQQTSQYTDTLKTYAGEYSQKAQELIGSARGQANGTTNGTGIKNSQLPNAPRSEPLPNAPTSHPSSTAPLASY